MSDVINKTPATQYIERGDALFDANSTKNLSPIFNVDDQAIQLRAYGLDEQDEIRVEMIHSTSKCGEVIAPFCPFKGQEYLDYEKNILLIGLPGRYRLVLTRKDGTKPSVGLVTVTATKVVMSQQVFHAYVGFFNRAEV